MSLLGAIGNTPLIELQNLPIRLFRLLKPSGLMMRDRDIETLVNGRRHGAVPRAGQDC